MKVMKHVIIIAIAVAMVFTMIPVVPQMTVAYADDSETNVSYDDDTSNKDLYEKMTSRDQAPAGYNDDLATSKDPYGYGVGVPFYMNKQSELVVYATNDMYDDTTTERTIKSYNLGTGENTGNILTGANQGTSYKVPMADKKLSKPLNYVKMVAFDPTGIGRKDHLAVIGVYNEAPGNDKGTKSLWLYVYSKDGKTVSQYQKLGNMNWLGDWGQDDDCAWYYNALNFLDITAGDYNGDRKDTLVIWGCFDGTDYGLQEVEVKETGSGDKTKITLNIKEMTENNTTYTVNKKLLHDEYINRGSALATSGYVDNKLCCSLDSGDVNGDHIDDLVVLSFVDILTKSANGRKQSLQMYAPYVTVSYGSKGLKKAIIDKDAKNDPFPAARVMTLTGSTDGKKQYLTCMAADVSLGDINGDGKDEIVVAGLKNEIRGEMDTAVAEEGDAFTNSRIQQSKSVIAAYSAEDMELTEKCCEMHDANPWAQRGYYPTTEDNTTNDNSLQQYAVECFYANGIGNPALVFVNGDIYRFESNKMTCVYTADYFTDTDTEFIGNGTDLTNTFIISADSGNFNGNEFGYEQVVYSFGVKVKDHERYFMAAGIVGADFTKGTTSEGFAKKYYSTSMETYETNSIWKNVYFPTKTDTRYISALIKNNYGLNYYICAIDNDEDGILVRFQDTGYVYTDPDILAVLQAAPRYDELSEYGANDNETSYSFSKSVSYEDTEGDSVSFGAGVTHGLEGTLGGYEVKAGYALDWSHEFSYEFVETDEQTFTADQDDAVVMYRTPVTLYYYQAQKPNGEWPDEDCPEEDDNGIVLSFPGVPAYSVMSVDKYNEFAAYYNKTNEKKMKELGKDVSKAPKLALLKDTDTQKLYLNTEGDPTKYINRRDVPKGVKILQNYANAFEVNTGSTGYSHTTEETTSDTNSMAHGFTFELTIEFDLGIECFVSSKAGAYVSLQYMHEKTHTESTTVGKGIACSVSNANEKEMKAAGYSSAACSSYGYNYQMAQWNSPITHEVSVIDKNTGKTHLETQQVPVYGYVLSEVKKPTYAKIKAPDTLILNEGYGAATSGTFTVIGSPSPKVTKVSGNSKITYNSVTRRLEVAPGLAANTYTVKLKADNGIPGKEYTCSFKVKVEKPDYSENGLINSVEEMIKALPTPKELLLSDEVYVQQARAAYNALTSAQKAKISDTLKKKLENAEKQIQSFKDAVAAAEEKVVQAVSELKAAINTIKPNITDGDDNTLPTPDDIQALKSMMEDIENIYNSLDNDQKALVSAKTTEAITEAESKLADLLKEYDKKTLETGELKKKADKDKAASDKVIALIDAIGDISAIDPAMTDEAAFEKKYQKVRQEVQDARAGYDALSTQQKAMVTNVDKLITAEKALGALETQRCNAVAAQQDDKAYKDAVSKIKAIPSTVTIKSDGKVLAARYAYDSLTPAMKKKVSSTLVTKLKNAEKKITSFKTAIKNNKPTISKVTGSKKALKVTWKKMAKKVSGVYVTGYQVQVATNSKFTKNKKTVTVKNYKTVTKTIKSLKAKTKYYVRVRTYLKTSTATYYSGWSKTKTCKTK